jgi:hypothetical protein
MSTFEYLSVFISIVIGLGVVHVLTALARIIVDRDSRPYWVHTLWGFNALYQLALFWWFTFDWRLQDVWTLPLFLFVVGFAMLTFLLSAIVVPLSPPADGDYRAYFYGHHRQIFGLWLAYAGVDTVDAILKGPEAHPTGLGVEFWLMGVVFWSGYGTAALTKNERFHQLWVIFWTAMIANDLLRWSDVFTG